MDDMEIDSDNAGGGSSHAGGTGVGLSAEPLAHPVPPQEQQGEELPMESQMQGEHQGGQGEQEEQGEFRQEGQQESRQEEQQPQPPLHELEQRQHQLQFQPPQPQPQPQLQPQQQPPLLRSILDETYDAASAVPPLAIPAPAVPPPAEPALFSDSVAASATPQSTTLEPVASDSADAETETVLGTAVAAAAPGAPAPADKGKQPAQEESLAEASIATASRVEGSHAEYDEATDATSSLFSTGLSIDSDADSAMGDIDAPSSTQSVRSSIYEFVEENGRTFHRYKQGKYFMPNDKSEQERLDLQHAIFVLLLKGLARAPIKEPHRVLDIGTGTGIWAIEFASMYPTADVIGTDLSPIQPDFVPPNCRFEIDDAEDDWAYGPTPFDFVHMRLLWHSFNDPRRVLRSVFENLRPGGYVEWQDFHSRFRAVDDSLNGSAITRLDRLYAEAGRNLGRDMLVTPKLAGMMREVGFVDVVEERYALPGNPWPKGREAKTLGFWQMTNFLEGMQAITMTVLTKGLGMSTTEVELLLMEVRKDVKNTNIHFYIPV
ncbi:methyltransferase type 12 [Niveomyces insectorum RCEF 264]|uniref:Methyltransferase type 12 n=1 Tax=Niveomyces insectorum RCEF 264 TaxID=1081102 RepID=A0A167SPT1_9HYPO|nr:methyltransferase type 12 [Niveomyces insectorum RCEF 264]